MLDPALTSSTRCLSSSVTSMMCATMPAEMTGLTGTQHDNDNDDDNDDAEDDVKEECVLLNFRHSDKLTLVSCLSVAKTKYIINSCSYCTTIKITPEGRLSFSFGYHLD